MLPFRALSPLLLTLVVAASGCTRDESYPNHPITLVCPWAKGGGTDGLSRQMAVLLERELDVAVNVENQTGGEGVTGHSAGAQARPDGYTLMMMTVELNMLHWRDLTSIRHRDFRTLMVLNRDAAALLVRSDAPWQSIGDLASEIKSRPGELKGSGTAKGGIWHLAFAGWLHAIGQSPTDVNWIPTRGAGPSLQELIAEKDRGLDLVCCSLPEAQPLMASGRVRALGVMAAERLAEFPDVPTFVEQGVDWSLGGWRALGVPAATPERIVERLLGALRKIVAGDEFLGFMRHRGFVIAVEEGDVAVSNLDATDAELGKLLRSPAFTGLDTSRFGPFFFPGVLGGLLAVTLIALVVRRIRGRVARCDSDSDERSPSAFALRVAHVWRFLLPIAAVVAYVLLAKSLGFLICAGAIVFLLLAALGNRLLVSATVTVVLIPLVYQLFAKGLRVPLPRGILWW